MKGEWIWLHVYPDGCAFPDATRDDLDLGRVPVHLDAFMTWCRDRGCDLVVSDPYDTRIIEGYFINTGYPDVLRQFIDQWVIRVLEGGG
jgi:hypothetical protein